MFYVILKRHKIKAIIFETKKSKPCSKIFLNSKHRFLFPNEFKFQRPWQTKEVWLNCGQHTSNFLGNKHFCNQSFLTRQSYCSRKIKPINKKLQGVSSKRAFVRSILFSSTISTFHPHSTPRDLGSNRFLNDSWFR